MQTTINKIMERIHRAENKISEFITLHEYFDVYYSCLTNEEKVNNIFLQCRHLLNSISEGEQSSCIKLKS